MMKVVSVVCMAMIGTAAICQDIDFSQTSTADLIQELQYVSTLSEPFKMNSTAVTDVKLTYAMIGVCEGKTLDDVNRDFSGIAKMAQILFGQNASQEVSEANYSYAEKLGCDPDYEKFAQTQSWLLELEAHWITQQAVSARKAELRRRLLMPTTLSEETSRIGRALTDSLMKLGN